MQLTNLMNIFRKYFLAIVLTTIIAFQFYGMFALRSYAEDNKARININTINAATALEVANTNKILVHSLEERISNLESAKDAGVK